MPEPERSRSNRWLTVILITPEEFGADREEVRLALEAENIEARPVWKPMHVQPVFQVEGRKAQGTGRKDFISKMSIASKEARETLYWIKLLKRSV